MAINYDFFPVHDIKSGKGKLRAKAVSNGTITTERLAYEMHKATSITVGEAKGFIGILVENIFDFLADGYDVQVGELGYFSVSVTSQLVDSPKEIRSESIRLRHINFRPAARFRKLMRMVPILRTADIFHKRTPVKTTVEQRAKKLKEHLDENLCISRLDYMRKTGLTKNMAVNELNAFIGKGWLRKYGSGRGVVYLLKKQD